MIEPSWNRKGLPSRDELLSERNAVIARHPKTVFIAPHVGSNAEFPPTVEIVAHENTKANMQKMPAFQGEGATFLPKRTYKDKLSLLSGNDRIDLYYFGPGHTNGDEIVVWPFLRVGHFGDLFSAKATPLIDTTNGGSGVEYPKTMAKAVSTATRQQPAQE